MMRPLYIVQVPLSGQESWFDLCRCTEVEHAVEVLRALLRSEGGPERITVVRQAELVRD